MKKREVVMTYPNGMMMTVQLTDAEIAKLVEDKKAGCLVISSFEILG